MGDKRHKKHRRRQKHVHEFQGSVMDAKPKGGVLHNHRFAGVSKEAIKTDESHVHVLKTRTDFFIKHYHKIDIVTGEAVPVFDENDVEIGHTHGVTGVTSINAKHNHVFKVATLIEDPLGQDEDMVNGKDEHDDDCCLEMDWD